MDKNNFFSKVILNGLALLSLSFILGLLMFKAIF